jgi:hypothetical protein
VGGYGFSGQRIPSQKERTPTDLRIPLELAARIATPNFSLNRQGFAGRVMESALCGIYHSFKTAA